MNSNDVIMGDRLKQLREENGIHQVDVARAVGISNTTYSNIETGYASSTKLKTAIALAKFFNVSVDYLLGLSDVREINKG